MKKRSEYSQGDIHIFANTLVDVATNGGVESMNRETALLNKMFESAMKGRVTMQRFMYREFERNRERLAAARARYDHLVIKWYIEKPRPNGLGADDIPFEVWAEIEALGVMLNYYYPGQYQIHRRKPEDDSE